MNTPTSRDDFVTPQPHSSEEVARARLHSLGNHVTEPRVRMLAVLMQDADAFSYQAVYDALSDDPGIDHVTVYRVFNWLVAGDIVYKAARADRVFRFDLTGYDTAQEAAHRLYSHLRCMQYGRDFCLGGAELPAVPMVALPAGFTVDHVELTIKDVRADCTPLASHHKTGDAPCPK